MPSRTRSESSATTTRRDMRRSLAAARTTNGPSGDGDGRAVPGGQPREALLEGHLRAPAQGGARPALVEPVRRSKLLGQEAGERGSGPSPGGGPDGLDD